MGSAVRLKELFGPEIRPEEVFPSLADERLGGGNQGLVLDHGRPVEELGAPFRPLVIQIERRDAGSLRLRRGVHARSSENGRCEVQTERTGVVGAAHFRLTHARIPDDQCYPDAFFVRIPFIDKAMLAVIVAIVTGEDDEGVLKDAQFLEFGKKPAAGCVHPGGEAVMVFHHRLIFLRCVEAPCPAIAAFVLCIRDERRQTEKGLLVGVDRDRDRIILIELHALRLLQELQRVFILGVGGEECQGQVKRLVGGRVLEELEGIVLVLPGDMNTPISPIRRLRSPSHRFPRRVGRLCT